MPDIDSRLAYVLYCEFRSEYYLDTIPDSEGEIIHLFDAKLINARKFVTEAQAERYANFLNKNNIKATVRKVKTVTSINEVEPKVTYSGKITDVVHEQPTQHITINLNEGSIEDLVKRISELVAKQAKSKGFLGFK